MKKFLILALVVFCTAGAVFANDLNVYPIPGVFASKNISDSAFNKVLVKYRSDFVKTFSNTFKQYFPKSVDKIDDNTRYQTFAAYVHVPRASQYHVKVSDSRLNIYLPLTMSINFVNMATGETLYSYPYTSYFEYKTSIITDLQKRKETIAKLCKQNYEETLETVIKQASSEFKPYNISAVVKDKYKNLYILDKGLDNGISVGDDLISADKKRIKIVYSALNYSVAKDVFSVSPEINDEFSKSVNGDITKLKKPKILFINDFGNEKLYNLFASALGNNAEFSLMTTDKTFFDMQLALASLNSDFKVQNNYERVLPDYFLKLYFTPPAYAQYKSNKDYLNVDKYEMLACGVIFDKSGRVVYSKCADDTIVNKVIGDVRFNNEANIEILAKNLFNKLAEGMQKDVRFKEVNFKITKSDGKFITLADTNGYLKRDNILTVYKKVKSDKNSEEILVPTWDYKVVEVNKGQVLCQVKNELKPYVNGIAFPTKRDIVRTNAITSGANKSNLFNYYPDKVEIDGNGLRLNSFESIAFAALTSTLKAPVSMHPADFEEQINDLNTYGFRDKISISRNNSDLTIKVVYKINLKSQERQGSALKQHYDVIIGIVSKKDGEIIKKDGLMQTITITVPKENNAAIIENELMKYIYPLIQQVATKF